MNSAAPGPVWTPLIPATMDQEKVKSFGEQSPMGRAAQPAELAPSYVFLASQESSYITADVIAVTGGSPIVRWATDFFGCSSAPWRPTGLCADGPERVGPRVVDRVVPAR